MTFDLAAAQVIVREALAEARRREAKPVAVIVLDAGGHPMAFAREDGGGLFRFDIARAKAMGALGMGADSSALTARATANPVFWQSLTDVVGGRLALSPGGVLARDGEGAVVGAVGISGDTGPCDEACALVGLRAAGFNPEGAA